MDVETEIADEIKERIKTAGEIEKISKRLKDENKIIVTTNGSFDLFHKAHAKLFAKAKDLGDYLIVLVNSDKSVRDNKGDKRPIILEDDRAYLVAALRSVDYVTIFDERTPLSLLKIIKPNFHVKGGSYIEERIAEERKLVESWGGEFRAFPLEAGCSTTRIIDIIVQRYS